MQQNEQTITTWMNRVNTYAVWVAFVLMGSWLVFLLARYAVNLFYHDQFALMVPITDLSNPLDLFFYRYARHRQGLAYVFWDWGVAIFGPDARIAAWLALFFMLGAAVVAVLALRGTVSPLWTDMIIPILFLNAILHETLFSASNPSHGPFPLLMVMGMAAALPMRSLTWKTIWLSLCSFLLIFSGFGFLGIPVVMGVAVLAIIGHVVASGGIKWRSPDLVPYYGVLLATLAGALLFLVDYESESALACFTGEILPARQGGYAARILGHSLGFYTVSNVGATVGLILGAVLVYITARGTLAMLRCESVTSSGCVAASQLVLTAGFALVFVLVTAYGRECQGAHSAMAARYLPYVMTGLWAVYMAARLGWFAPPVGRPEYSLLASVIVIALAMGLLHQRAQSQWVGGIAWVNSQKMQILECSGGDPEQFSTCQQTLDIEIYPGTRELEQIISRIYAE